MATASDSNPQAGAGRPLPKKEADTFRNLVKHYEMKQYKKALKQADVILKKYPNHGETLAMKGLTLYYMSKQDEAHELVKLGLRNDLRSHVCWHVLGLLHRGERNYNEAIKAYKQALRIDPENMQILRDLSFLQVQMRDLDGFVTSRNQLLSLKSNFKINWMAFALARHLAGDLDGAIKVIDTYLSTLSEGSSELGRCFESSELALYRNSILAEKPNNYKAALDHLGVVEGIVVDRGAWLMKRAEYELRLSDFDAAKQSALTLMARGMTENYSVHSLYMCAVLQLSGDIVQEYQKLKGTRTVATTVVLTPEQKQHLRNMYETEVQPSFPRSHAVQRIPFSLMGIDDLCVALEGRCKKDLVRGVPSLCSELFSYIFIEENGRYVNPVDPVDIKPHPVVVRLVKMVDGWITNLESSSKFTPEDETVVDSSTVVWAWFLRASIHELCGEFSEGISLTEKCLEKDPSIVDVYELKARLLKSAGNIEAAADCVDKGRDLDLSDRYINNQTTKYLLQAGKPEEALKRISLFTRHEGNPEQNLYDMQCSWYELELAECLLRQGERGKSLKKFSAVAKHFEDFNEDQFDFHAYCLRKVTLRAYIDVLRYEDVIYGQQYFCRAAAGIIRIYLELADNPDKEDEAEPDYSSMTAAERKRAKAIARKKKRKTGADKKEEPANKASNGDKGKQGKNGKSSFIDEDPDGEELLKKDPLEEGKKFSSMLAIHAPKELDTWILRYDVAIRRGKALICLQALHKARAIAPENSKLFTRVVDFEKKRQSLMGLSPVVSRLLDDEAPSLVGNMVLNDFVMATYVRISQVATTDLHLRVEVAKALVEHNVGTVTVAANLITKDGLGCRSFTVESCQKALRILRSFGAEASSATEKWVELVRAKYPLASLSP